MRTLPCRLVAAGAFLLPAVALAQSQPTRLAVDSTIKIDTAALAAAADAAPVPQAPGTGEFHFSVTPYLWVTKFDGDVAADGVSGHMENDLGDAFSDLDKPRGAAGVHLEFGWHPWSIFVDGMVMKISDHDDPALRMTDKHMIGELGVAYALFDSNPGGTEGGGVRVVVEPLGGVRVHYSDLDVGTGAHNRMWVDAFGGGRIRISFDEPFALFGRADFGGGMSNFTWSAMAGAEIRFAEWIRLDIGYKWMKTDFDDGTGPDFFNYDVLVEGPFLGLTFAF